MFKYLWFLSENIIFGMLRVIQSGVKSLLNYPKWYPKPSDFMLMRSLFDFLGIDLLQGSFPKHPQAPFCLLFNRVGFGYRFGGFGLCFIWSMLTQLPQQNIEVRAFVLAISCGIHGVWWYRPAATISYSAYTTQKDQLIDMPFRASYFDPFHAVENTIRSWA